MECDEQPCVLYIQVWRNRQTQGTLSTRKVLKLFTLNFTFMS